MADPIQPKDRCEVSTGAPTIRTDRGNSAWFHATFAIVIATLTSSCLKGPGFLQQGENEAATTLVSTANDQGDVSGSISAAMNNYQQILAAADSGVSGASVIFPPGSLVIDTSVVVGQGADAAGADVLAALGLSSQSVQALGTSLFVGTTDTSDPVAPMTLSIPISSGTGLHGFKLDDSDKTKYAITFIGEKKTTGETFAGFIPNDELTIENGMVSFETDLWGSYRLVKIDEVAETDTKPTKRVAEKIPGMAPVRHNEIKDNAKMVITGRTPFVVAEGASLTISGENLTDVTAKIGRRTLRSDVSKDGRTMTISIPKKSDLSRYGMFIVSLKKLRSNSDEVNFVLTEHAPDRPVVVAPATSRQKVCARQKFFDVLANELEGTGTSQSDSTSKCSGEYVSLDDCDETKSQNCVTRAAASLSNDNFWAARSDTIKGDQGNVGFKSLFSKKENYFLDASFTNRRWMTSDSGVCPTKLSGPSLIGSTLADYKIAFALGALIPGDIDRSLAASQTSYSFGVPLNGAFEWSDQAHYSINTDTTDTTPPTLCVEPYQDGRL